MSVVHSMRVLAIGSLAVLLLLVPSLLHAEDAAHRIEQQLRQWSEDFNAGRVDRLCDLFAPDLIANYRGQPEKNYASLCSALRENLSEGSRSFHYELELQEIIVSGDMAVARLIWHLNVTDQETGAIIRSADRGLDVFRLQPDGEWRISRFIAYEMEGD